MIAWFTEGGVDPVDVTAIVLACDRGRHVGQALASVRAQTWSGWELLLSDTSTQPQRRANTEAAFQAHARAVSPHGGRLLRPGPGLSRVENLAAAWDAVRTPYVALLDANDVWMPEHLARARAWLGADARRGVAISNSVSIDDQGRTKGCRHPVEISIPPENDLDGSLAHLLREPFSSTSGLVLRKSALRRHRFHATACVDVHLGVSALLASARVGLFTTPSFYERTGADAPSTPNAAPQAERHRLLLHLARRHGLALTRRVPTFPLIVLKSAGHLAADALRRFLTPPSPPPAAAPVGSRPQSSLPLR